MSVCVFVRRCKALAGLCVRTIRIELQLHVARALHELGQVPHLVETSEEAREVSDVCVCVCVCVCHVAQQAFLTLCRCQSTAHGMSTHRLL